MEQIIDCGNQRRIVEPDKILVERGTIMVEINYMALEDMLHDARMAGMTRALQKTLVAYIRADKKYQRVSDINGYGSRWQADVLEDPDQLFEDLSQKIDKAFTTLTICKKEYKKVSNQRLFDGGIGRPKAECTAEEWASFRPEKADLLDQVVAYFMVKEDSERRFA